MKHTHYLIIVSALFVLSSCGGEKASENEEKEEKKFDVTVETKEKAYDMAGEVMAVRNELIGVRQLHHFDSPLKYVEKTDSLIELINKLDKSGKTAANAYMDSLMDDVAIAREIEEVNDEMVDSWDNVSGEYTEFYTKVDEKKISDKDALKYLEEFPKNIEQYKSHIKAMHEKWIPVARHQAGLEAILSGTK